MFRPSSRGYLRHPHGIWHTETPFKRMLPKAGLGGIQRCVVWEGFARPCVPTLNRVGPSHPRPHVRVCPSQPLRNLIRVSSHLRAFPSPSSNVEGVATPFPNEYQPSIDATKHENKNSVFLKRAITDNTLTYAHAHAADTRTRKFQMVK